MNKTSIFACREPRRGEWQLGRLPPAAGRMTLIGWKQDPDPIDAGVPKEVAAVLARALTSLARVTFPSSIEHASATGRVVGPRKGAPGDLVLVWTTDAETAMQAFDDPGYPWWLQGQVLLMSASTAAGPDISRNQLLALFAEEWAREAATLAQFGVVGIVRPGVDGDMAGLLSLSAGFDDAMLAALEREALLASFEWSVVTEEAFPVRYSG